MGKTWTAVALVVTSCASMPPDGADGTIAAGDTVERVGLCVYQETLGPARVDDRAALDISGETLTISAEWRATEWWPVEVPGTVADWATGQEIACPVRIDMVNGAWTAYAACGGREWTAVATRCESSVLER